MTESMDIEDNQNEDEIVIERIWAYLQLATYRRKLDNPRLTEGVENLLTSAVTELALGFEFVTPWTSMIVVDDTIYDILNATDDTDDSGTLPEEYYGYDYDSDVSAIGGYYYFDPRLDSISDHDIATDSGHSDSGVSVYSCAKYISLTYLLLLFSFVVEY